MDKANQRSIIAIPITLFVAAGLALAGRQGSYQAFGLPVFSLCIVLAFIIQWIAFILAYLKQTEKFFDRTGSITFISVVVLAVVLSPVVDGRSLLLMGMVLVWALHLGTFLYKRVHAAGEDQRFREIKKSFARFLLTWTLQGLWVSFSLAAALK